MPQFEFEGKRPQVHPDAWVANGATVLDGARVGKRTMIAANALVAAGAEIPDEVLVVRCSRT